MHLLDFSIVTRLTLHLSQTVVVIGSELMDVLVPLNLLLPDLQERSLFPNIKYYSQNLSLELMVGQWRPPVHRLLDGFRFDRHQWPSPRKCSLDAYFGF
ncbi:hypothetical protein ACVWYQ_003204 [Bradyrhizobium sp. USDA 3397]